MGDADLENIFGAFFFSSETLNTCVLEFTPKRSSALDHQLSSYSVFAFNFSRVWFDERKINRVHVPKTSRFKTSHRKR
jgi:hypothetical protein